MNKNKILAMLLSATIISSLTPAVYAADAVTSDSSNQSIDLQNSQITQNSIDASNTVSTIDTSSSAVSNTITTDNSAVIDSNASSNMPTVDANSTITNMVDNNIVNTTNQTDNTLSNATAGLNSLNNSIDASTNNTTQTQNSIDASAANHILNSKAAKASSGNQLADGEYEVTFTSNGSKYIKESILEVKNGKMKLKITYNYASMITINEVTVNQNPVNVDIGTIDNNELPIEFEIDSIQDDINMAMTVTISPTMIHNYDIGFEINDVKLIQSSNNGSNSGQTSLADGEYEVTFTSNGSKYIKESILEVKNGKMKLKITYNYASMITINEVAVNQNPVNVNIGTIDNNELPLEFEIDSIQDDINMAMTVTISPTMIHNYDIGFEINDVKLIQSSNNGSNSGQTSLADGNYKLDYNLYKEGTKEDSKIASYIENCELEVSGGKKKAILTFTSSSMIPQTTAKVNGNNVNVTRTELSNDKFSMEFEIDSFSDVISLGVDVNTPWYSNSYNVDFVINGIDNSGSNSGSGDNNQGGSNSGSGDNNNQGGNVGDSSQGGNTDTTPDKDVLNDGQYTIDVKVLKTGTNETSTASGYVNSQSNLKVENGKYNLTLGFTDISIMSNIEVTVDGTKVNSNIITNNDGTGSVSFNINALNSNILIACNVKVPQIGYDSDVDFNIALDKSTLKDSSGGTIDAPVEEVIIPLDKNTSYIIENEISLNGSNQEAASYLDPNSTIQIEDSSMYMILTFNTSGFMNGRTITLNNNNGITRYTVDNSNGKTVVKFKISSLNDKVKISSSSSNSVDDGFTVTMLSDTLIENSTSSNNGSSSNGSSNSSDDDDDDDEDLDDGTYTIKNKALKENSDSTSDARGYLDSESIITVKNGKIYLTLKFTHGKMMSDTSIKVEGKKTSYTVVKNSGNKYYIKFRINSLSDEVLVTSTIDTGLSSIGVLDDVKFRVLLRSSTLEEDDDADDYDDDDEDDSDDEAVSGTDTSTTLENQTDISAESQLIPLNSQNTLTTSEQNKKVRYKVNNEIITDSKIGYQAARGAVNESSYYDMENGKNYITLGFSQTDILNNIRLSVGGKVINYDIVNENKSNNTMDIRFEIPAISNEVTVTANVTAMGRDISFGVKFLESTLQLISSEEDVALGDNSSASVINTSALSGGSSTGTTGTGSISSKSGSNMGQEVIDLDGYTDEALEDIAVQAKEYFKKYTIENEVISDSAIGRSMARKYLNQTSIIEEIDGKFYATVTFSSSSSMGDFRIEVNGETVEHSVVLNDIGNELISLRFPINDVNDDIRAYIYIKPMKMNINFGIKFLENTMNLIEEGTIGDEDNQSSSSLADTLAQVNENSTKDNSNKEVSAAKIAVSTSALTIILSQLLAYLGPILKRKFLSGKILKK